MIKQKKAIEQNKTLYDQMIREISSAGDDGNDLWNM